MAAATLPLSVALWGQPAQGAVGSGLGTAVMKCMHFKGAMIVKPGLTTTPAHQTIAAHGRVYGCNKAGGGAKFTANLTATGATCANRRFSGPATFVWANGRTSVANLTFLPAPVEPKKVEVVGIVTGGLFRGLLVHSWVRITDTFKGTGPGCSSTNPLQRIDFTNSQSLQLFTPPTVTTTVPQTPTTAPPPTSAATTPTTTRVIPQGTTATTATTARATVPVSAAGGGGTAAPQVPGPSGSLAFTGNSSTGALLGLESLIVGGAIWALGGRGRRRDLSGRARRKRRAAQSWLMVTMPGDRG